MRQHKCRIWYKNEMILPGIGNMFYIDNEGVWELVWDMFTSSYNSELCSDAVVMLYTGLKDSNGVDIYEGDIIVRHSWAGNKFRTLVEWDEERMTFKLKDQLSLFEISLNYRLEVVGNLYENGEMLYV